MAIMQIKRIDYIEYTAHTHLEAQIEELDCIPNPMAAMEAARLQKLLEEMNAHGNHD